MKTQQQLEQLIAGQLKFLNEKENKELLTKDELTPEEKKAKREYKKTRKEYDFNVSCLSYVKSAPSEVFLLKEKDRLSTALKTREEAFSVWSRNICPVKVEPKDRKALYRKELGLIQIEKQIKHLNYILA